MTAPVVWEPTLAALDAARTTASGVRGAQAEDIGTRLRSLGTSYDLRYTPEVQIQRSRDETDYQARERAAYELVRSPFTTLDTQARALDPLTDAPIPFSYPESPAVAASATLGGLDVTALEPGSFGNTILVSIGMSSSEQLLKGLNPPLYQDIIVSIQSSALTEPEKEEAIGSILAARAQLYAASEAWFSLRVTRGSQVELFDNLTVKTPSFDELMASLATSVHTEDQKAETVAQIIEANKAKLAEHFAKLGSKLVSFRIASNVRPTSGAMLSGGRGGVFAALSARISRVQLVPGVSRELKESMRLRLQRITPRIPPLVYSVPFGGPREGIWYPGPKGTPGRLPSIQSVENELVKAIAEAEAWLAT